MEQGKKIMKMEFLRRLLNFSIILCLLENIGYSSNIRLIESEFTCIHCCQQSWFFQFFDNHMSRFSFDFQNIFKLKYILQNIFQFLTQIFQIIITFNLQLILQEFT